MGAVRPHVFKRLCLLTVSFVSKVKGFVSGGPLNVSGFVRQRDWRRKEPRSG